MKLGAPQSQGEKLLCGTLLRLGEGHQIRLELQVVGWALDIVHNVLLSLRKCKKDSWQWTTLCPEVTGENIPVHLC